MTDLPHLASPSDAGAQAALGLAALPVWHLLLRQRGLYQARRGRSRVEEARALVGVTTFGSLLVATAALLSGVGDVRVTLVTFWALAGLGLVAFRFAIRTGLRALRRRGYNARSVLVVGTGPLALGVWSRLHGQPEAGFRVSGFLAASSLDRVPASAPPILGGIEELAPIVEERAIDQVVIAVERSSGVDATKLVRELERTAAGVRIVLDLEGLRTVQAGLEDLDGLPTLRLVESPILGWQRVGKRLFDATAAAAGLLLLAPLFVTLAAAVRASGPRAPVLFRQRRMGLDGRLFTMLKFRSMVPGAEADGGPRWAARDDSRCTVVGRWLRRTNLDELPQLWNVLRGDMSLVGPRPERPELIERFRCDLPGYMLRHKAKAGMTGWAQVNGLRGNTSLERRLAYDIDYLRRWSFVFDLRILLLTLVRSFRDPNAY